MIWMLLALWAGAADGTCERIGWRLGTLEAVAEPDQGQVVQALRMDALRQHKGCPVEAPPQRCREEGLRRARAGVLAFEQLMKAVAAAQEQPDVGTLITRRREALRVQGAMSDVAIQSRNRTLAGNSGALAQDADAILDAVPGQLTLRRAAEADIHRAEQVWLDAARAWNAARCACDEVCVPAPGGTTKMLGRLRTLHGELVETQATFLDSWSLEVLTERIRASDAGDVGEPLLRYRAAALQVALSENGARPHGARHVLAGLLASVDGEPDRDPDTQRALVAWTVYGGAWRRHMRRLDKHIDRILKAWARVDAAEGRTATDLANGRLRAAFDALEEGVPGTPSGL